MGRISDLYITYKPQPFMAEAEHPEKYNWWLNELDSLGISTLQKNGLGNHKEASDLTEAAKQTLYVRLIAKVTDSETGLRQS